MAHLGMVIDLQRCIGCNGCTIACKSENGTPPGVHFSKVLEKERGTYPNVTRDFIPVLCNHCEDAPCERACPTGATTRRDDGIVMVDYDKCIGCRACYVSCPYVNRAFLPKGSLSKGYYGNSLTPFEAVKYKEFTEGTVVKCTFCAKRVDQGLEPACVVTCATEARIFGDLDDPDSKVSKLIRQSRMFQLLPEANTKPSVYYLRR
ncbi:MAG: 4Fe-4S dicluster domain-containing protein [Firmicutes bacterium]|nr:4Fe-4S dicluster domain-containing protein [Bacillota bacterium]